MLNDNDWDFYYHLLSLEKKNAPNAKKQESYKQFLDTSETREFLKSHGSFEGPIHTLTLESTAITCSACAWLLEKVLSDINGVTDYAVDFLHATVRLSYDNNVVKLRGILEKTWRIGYPLKPASNTGKPSQKPHSDMAAKIAVAGACFMNIMIFSIAGYFGLFSGISESFRNYFSWGSLFLTIPVVTYSAQPFYAKAIGGLKKGVFHMDVPVSLGILFAFTMSVIATFQSGDMVFYDSAAGLVFFLLVGRWGTRRFEQRLTVSDRWFERVRPDKARVVRKTEVHYIPVEDLQPGDLILVPAGEYIPIDGRIAGPEGWLDTSLLTGETKPVKLLKNEKVFSGYKNLVRDLPVLVEAGANTSRVQRLEDKLSQLSDIRNSRKGFSERIAPWFTLIVLTIAAAAFFYHLPAGLNTASNIVVAVLIVSCPCALALAVPLSLGIAANRSRKMGFYLKSPEIFHTLNTTRAILFDKTGTLTYSSRTIRTWQWLDTSPDRQKDILPCLKKLCRQSLHPVSRTVLESLSDIKETENLMIGFEEMPHKGIQADFERLGKLSLQSDEKADAVVVLDQTPVLALTFSEEIKPSVPRLIESLETMQRYPVLVSGDNKNKVTQFAKRSGFKTWHAELQPEQKLDILSSAQKSHGPVLAIGDGYNDALLLGGADVSMVVHGGAQSLSGKADILFIQQDFNQLKRLLELADSVPNSIKANYIVSFTYNIFAIGLAASGFVAPIVAAILMPLSSLTVCVLTWRMVKRA